MNVHSGVLNAKRRVRKAVKQSNIKHSAGVVTTPFLMREKDALGAEL